MILKPLNIPNNDNINHITVTLTQNDVNKINLLFDNFTLLGNYNLVRDKVISKKNKTNLLIIDNFFRVLSELVKSQKVKDVFKNPAKKMVVLTLVKHRMDTPSFLKDEMPVMLMDIFGKDTNYQTLKYSEKEIEIKLHI